MFPKTGRRPNGVRWPLVLQCGDYTNRACAHAHIREHTRTRAKEKSKPETPPDGAQPSQDRIEWLQSDSTPSARYPNGPESKTPPDRVYSRSRHMRPGTLRKIREQAGPLTARPPCDTPRGFQALQGRFPMRPLRDTRPAFKPRQTASCGLHWAFHGVIVIACRGIPRR